MLLARLGKIRESRRRLKEAMQPKPVITGLVARDDLHRAVQLSRNTRADLLDEFKKPLPIAAFQRVSTDLLGQRSIDRDDPALLAQFNCQEAAYHRILARGGR
jgi:hypothetical protein